MALILNLDPSSKARNVLFFLLRIRILGGHLVTDHRIRIHNTQRLTLLFTNNIIPCSSCSLPPPPPRGKSFHTCHLLINFWKYKYWNLNTTADTIQGKCKSVRLIKWKHHFTNLSSCTVERQRNPKPHARC